MCFSIFFENNLLCFRVDEMISKCQENIEQKEGLLDHSDKLENDVGQITSDPSWYKLAGFLMVSIAMVSALASMFAMVRMVETVVNNCRV
jgi:hypothetical protein